MSEPIYTTTQTDKYSVPSFERIEPKACDLPLVADEILDIVERKDIHTVETTCDYDKIGYCCFRIGEDGDLEVERLAYHRDHVQQGLDSLFAIMLDTPMLKTPKIRIRWPEFDIENPTFKYLLDRGFVVAEMESYFYTAYGEKWDAIILEK